MYMLLLPVCFVFSTFLTDSEPLKYIEVPLGGNTYQIQHTTADKIDKNGIEKWHSRETVWHTYIFSGTEKKVTITMECNEIPSNNWIEVGLNEEKFRTIPVKNVKDRKISLGTCQFKKGYNLIRFKSGKKGIAPFPKVRHLNISYRGIDDFKFVRDNIDQRFYWGRRGPSVHLSYAWQENVRVKWFYNEMTIPIGKDPIGSYFMANGFREGYFGIQVNSQTERRILFSVWSPFSTNNQNEIPENQKIRMLKKGAGVFTGEFGNEGSGGQSYLIYPWKAGVTYAFLNAVEPDGMGNTIYSAYFKDPDNQTWILIARFLRPQTNTWLTRPHSFLENFIADRGYLNREVWYQNQWVADENGKWYPIQKATFTGDDIARRQYRADADGGVKGAYFFLTNGGFFNTNTPLNTAFSLALPKTSPYIDFTGLP